MDDNDGFFVVVTASTDCEHSQVSMSPLCSLNDDIVDAANSLILEYSDYPDLNTEGSYAADSNQIQQSEFQDNELSCDELDSPSIKDFRNSKQKMQERHSLTSKDAGFEFHLKDVKLVEAERFPLKEYDLLKESRSDKNKAHDVHPINLNEKETITEPPIGNQEHGSCIFRVKIQSVVHLLATTLSNLLNFKNTKLHARKINEFHLSSLLSIGIVVSLVCIRALSVGKENRLRLDIKPRVFFLDKIQNLTSKRRLRDILISFDFFEKDNEELDDTQVGGELCFYDNSLDLLSIPRERWGNCVTKYASPTWMLSETSLNPVEINLTVDSREENISSEITLSDDGQVIDQAAPFLFAGTCVSMVFYLFLGNF